MMSKNTDYSHRTTKFDIACDELSEFNKTYENNLSYGYYSALEKMGHLPAEWYDRIAEIWKSVSDDLNNFDAEEHQEYKRRYHSKISFSKYIKKREEGKLNPKWYQFLIISYKYREIPKDYRWAKAEYLEYIQKSNDTLTFFEYYEKKAAKELPDEWYDFLEGLKEVIEELLENFSI